VDLKCWMTPGEAAQVLHLSPSRVRVLADSRRLRTFRTPSGRRLIASRSVEAFRLKRDGSPRSREHSY
jgi:excisionase family DNA binding protein